MVCRLRILYLTDIQSSSLPSNRSSNVFYCMRYLRYFLRLVFSSQVGSDPPAPHVSTIYVHIPRIYGRIGYWVRVLPGSGPGQSRHLNKQPHIADDDSSRSHSLQVTESRVVCRFLSHRHSMSWLALVVLGLHSEYLYFVDG